MGKDIDKLKEGSKIYLDNHYVWFRNNYL